MEMHALKDDLKRSNVQDEREENRLDLNTISEKQLIQCFGLSELTAKRMIERRNVLTRFT